MTVSQFQVEDGYECPTCGKVVGTSLGLKQHHAKVHGESLVETAECIWCGEEFQKSPSRTGRFCSRECFGEHRTEHGVPARKRSVEIECANCGTVFETPRSVADDKRYCSNECYHGDSDAGTVVCEMCGDKFYVHGHRIDDARFCGQECYGKHLSENWSGQNSPHWRGGKIEHQEYGSGWGERKRRMVRERDGRECQRCGMTQAEHLEEHGMKLHVHHEVKVRESENPAVHNAMRNLRTLCIACHMAIE